jgi:hypothetical protein
MVLRNALARAAAPLRCAAQAQLSSAGVIGTLAPLARAGAPRHYRNPVENELYDRSRQEYSLGNRVPSVAADAWIAPNATLVGDADVADQCSVWHGAVLKGDLGPVRLGAFSNVQERCVIDAAGCVERIPRFSPTPTVSARARGPAREAMEATRAPDPRDPPREDDAGWTRNPHIPHVRATTIGRVIGLFYGSTRVTKKKLRCLVLRRVRTPRHPTLTTPSPIIIHANRTPLSSPLLSLGTAPRRASVST